MPREKRRGGVEGELNVEEWRWRGFEQEGREEVTV